MILSLVVEAMDAGAVAFRDQLRLRRQPVLDLVAGPRTLVHVAEVGGARHLVRRRHEIDFGQASARGWQCWGGSCRILSVFIMFHKVKWKGRI